jgi:hypothetical protein
MALSSIVHLGFNPTDSHHLEAGQKSIHGAMCLETGIQNVIENPKKNFFGSKF